MPARKLAGQPPKFETTATAIEAPQDAVIDDEFAKTLGLNPLDKLKEAARERLTGESPAPPGRRSSACCWIVSTRPTASRRRRRWSRKNSS